MTAIIRAGGRDLGLVAFEVEVVAFFYDAAEILGVPKSVAAIYGICFASAEPLSFADINERLDISAGSISQGIRVLREIGALKLSDDVFGSSLVSRPSSLVVRSARQRERFAPDLELRKLATHFIEQRLEKQLTAGKQRLQTMKAAIPAAHSDCAKELRARLKYLQSWHDKSRKLVPLVKTFLKLS